MPLDVVAHFAFHNSRAPIGLSPDGQWVAHTMADSTMLATEPGLRFSATGVSFAEGYRRKHARLTHTQTGEVIELGSPDHSSWSPAWSPDGERVAFYSDEHGAAALWIWEKKTGARWRFPGVLVRPVFGFETPQWFPDSRRVLCKILPEGVGVAQANESLRRIPDEARFAPFDENVPSVRVQKSPADEPQEARDSYAQAIARDSDLAVLDLDRRAVTRVAVRTQASWYAAAPDGRHVAYTRYGGPEENTQQEVFDLVLWSAESRATSVLAEGLYLRYGISVSWSPDSRKLAYVTGGQLASGECHVADLEGRNKRLGVSGKPDFSDPYRAPLWDARGRHVYLLAQGKVWRLDTRTGQSIVAAAIPDRMVTGIIGRAGDALWVIATDGERARNAIHRLDLQSGETRLLVEEPKHYSTTFNAAVDKTGATVVFVAEDIRHPPDIWAVHSRGDRTPRQVTHLNAAFEKYELGESRLIGWKTPDGRELQGALLLPPGYSDAEPLPLVVWVYGGSNGSHAVNRFGFWGHAPAFNFHVLATRGYAVLFPDAPLRVGSPMKDLMLVVMPGVDTVIELGIADPQRLAIMGQSYGSYCTLAIITQTQRFKAAIISGVFTSGDLLGSYLSGATGYYERGQGRMGGTLWEYPGRYLDNSPLFLYDRISTPLLMAHGSDDGSLREPNGAFTALRRLGKPVEYRIYGGEGHVFERAANVIDFWQRRLEFLQEHLGAP